MSAPKERDPGVGPERNNSSRKRLSEIKKSDRQSVRPEKINPSEIIVIKADETGWLPVTNAVTASEYVVFHKDFVNTGYNQKNDKFQEIWLDTLQNVCKDKYSSSERSRTLMAFTKNAGVVGQVRVGMGKANDLYPIEAMDLFEANGKWPHELDNIPNDKICEIGRVVVSPGQRPDNTIVVLRSLMRHAFNFANEQGYVQAYTIKPTKHPNPEAPIGKLAPLHARFVEIGIEPEVVPNAILREDHPIVEIYPGYFMNLEPKVFHWRTLPRIEA